MVYPGAPVIRLDSVFWWTTAGDNTHSHTDVDNTHTDTRTQTPTHTHTHRHTHTHTRAHLTFSKVSGLVDGSVSFHHRYCVFVLQINTCAVVYIFNICGTI